ncbi:ChrR family anti-sigma-E factor [Mesobacterium pallidum]|uniref:ChrR family anti-sigma-E factor n=1 Tax=Mesobacterium pallidum TaxID=2872037 RepID=UPI001EE2C9C8|nr:ChrR family anti-sigma-E factor [Mesobacterium pallidum]
MTIRHHISDSLLAGYAAGTLPEAFNLIIATHVSVCDDCRAALGAFEALGGAVLDDVAPIAMGHESLSACMARIKSGEGATEPPARPKDPVLPAPLAEYVGGGLDAIRWRPVGMGVKQAILPTDKGASARLLYIPAGQSVPDHSHRGLELTMVLQGAFSDQTDRFARGDVETADDDLEHTPVAEAGEDCICLAVTDAPLKFKGWMPRLAQPFLKI